MRKEVGRRTERGKRKKKEGERGKEKKVYMYCTCILNCCLLSSPVMMLGDISDLSLSIKLSNQLSKPVTQLDKNNKQNNDFHIASFFVLLLL